MDFSEHISNDNFEQEFMTKRYKTNKIYILLTIFSVCAPLIKFVFNLTDVNTVIHTHSTYSQVVANGDSPFKFIGFNQCPHVNIPIVDDVPNLEEVIQNANEFPSHAVLVRQHGLFVWGSSMQITFER